MKIVCIEEHFLTEEITDASDAASIGSEGTSVLDQGEIGTQLHNLGEGDLALMDESGIDVQVFPSRRPRYIILKPGRVSTWRNRSMN